MTRHRATCEDCPWSYSDEDLVDVSDEMERHARKEMHDVDLERAVATDGGRVTSSGGTGRSDDECPRCGDDGIPNPVLDGWFECNNCVIAFNEDGEVESDV